MRRARALGPVLVSLAAACGAGAHGARSANGRAAPSGSIAASASAGASASASVGALGAEQADPATAWTWGAIACWIGPPWAEALGAIGEERTLARDRRCRVVLHWALRVPENDARALEAMVDADEAIVARVADAIAKKSGPRDMRASLVRAVAAACREDRDARRAAERLREHGDLAREQGALGADAALAKLANEGFGDATAAARLVALVLAADRIESTRDLDGRARVLGAAPALAVEFGVKAPAGAGDDAYAALLAEAATKGGHAPKKDASADDAYADVAAAFADRFDALAGELGRGEGYRVAHGYALRLRQGLEARAKRLVAPATSASASTSPSASAPAKPR